MCRTEIQQVVFIHGSSVPSACTHTHRRTYGIHNTKRANVHKYQSGRKPSSLSACIPHNLYQHKIIWFCCFRRQSFTGIRCVHSETFTVRFDILHAKFRILPGTKRVWVHLTVFIPCEFPNDSDRNEWDGFLFISYANSLSKWFYQWKMRENRQ